MAKRVLSSPAPSTRITRRAKGALVVETESEGEGNEGVKKSNQIGQNTEGSGVEESSTIDGTATETSVAESDPGSPGLDVAVPPLSPAWASDAGEAESAESDPVQAVNNPVQAEIPTEVEEPDVDMDLLTPLPTAEEVAQISLLYLGYLTQAILTRVLNLNELNAKDRGVFAAGKVPKGQPFGKQDHYNYTNFVVSEENAEPIRVWVAGWIHKLQMMEAPGVPARMPWMVIKPLVPHDLIACNNIINHYSHPETNYEPNALGTIITNRFQAPFNSVPTAPGMPFTDTYLATQSLHLFNKTLHARYDTSQLKAGDFVAVEMRVKKRAIPSNARDGPSAAQRSAHVSTSGTRVKLTDWSAAFQFENIFVLAIGPAVPEAPDVVV